jgi:hypothetical protein
MNQWLICQGRYLDILLESEGRKFAPKCSMCSTVYTDIKCSDCFRANLFCKPCCLDVHKRSPFHQTLCWTRQHYAPTSLHSLGFLLCLGHNGKSCPKTVEVGSFKYSFTCLYSIAYQGVKAAASKGRRTKQMSSASLQSVQEDVPNLIQLPMPRETPQPDDTTTTSAISDTLYDFLDNPSDSPTSNVNCMRTGKSGNPQMTIVDCRGVFEMEVLFCTCSNSQSRDKLLLGAGLFPATFKQIETLFSFTVLDDFLIDNLECKTTALQYYSKLQSMTSNMFPDNVPVRHRPPTSILNVEPLSQNRYKQLLRASRQWRDLKKPDEKRARTFIGARELSRWINCYLLPCVSAAWH